MAAITQQIPSFISQVKSAWTWVMSLNRATHVKFSLSANDNIDYMLALVQLGSAWTVTIITGFGTFMMVSKGLEQYNPAPWISYTISGIVAGFMWLLTDVALGNFVEMVAHNTLSIFYKPFWKDFLKNFKKRPKTDPTNPQPTPGPSLSTLANAANQPQAPSNQDDDYTPRYSIPSRFIQVAFTIGISYLIYQFYLIDYSAVKIIQQPIADKLVVDTPRDLKAERQAIIDQTQPNIDRILKDIAKVEEQEKNAWTYSINRPWLAKFKILLPNDKYGWAKGQIKTRFYNDYLKGLRQKLADLEQKRDALEMDQRTTLSAITNDVNQFNQKNTDRVEAQTGIVFASIFALGFVAKKAYGGAVTLRTLWYMSETNGGRDVDGDGQLTRKDMHAHQSGKTSINATNKPTPPQQTKPNPNFPTGA